MGGRLVEGDELCLCGATRVSTMDTIDWNIYMVGVSGYVPGLVMRQMGKVQNFGIFEFG